MADLSEKEVEADCPYCGETIGVLVDCSVEEQDYIEDCQVCCRPMRVRVRVGDGEKPELTLSQEDEA